jgi:hypothetical protein
MMVDAIETLLRDERWLVLQRGRKTQLLTLGQCYPVISLVRRTKANEFRESLRRLCFSKHLCWWDVTAKIDPLCFYKAHPLVKTEIEYSKAPMPVLHSARFFKMYTAQSWERIRKNKFDAHLLYLRAPELNGNFNLFDVLFGPITFEQHVQTFVENDAE